MQERHFERCVFRFGCDLNVSDTTDGTSNKGQMFMESRGVSLTRRHSCRGPMRSVPPRGSGWVRTSRTVHRLPTRYRDVVLTSWDRGMNDCESDPSVYSVVVLTSWDRVSSQCERDLRDPTYRSRRNRGRQGFILGARIAASKG